MKTIPSQGTHTMIRLIHRPLSTVLIAMIVLAAAGPALAGSTVLLNICRVKGLSEKTLVGAGLVFGLAGTGDGAKSLPTIRALARTMELMGITIGEDFAMQLKSAKNVALVTVTATISAKGAQPGELIDCRVSAISAKSLAGGRLFTTPLLLGQNLKNDRNVYGMASGNIELEKPDKGPPTAGTIHNGCQVQVEYVPSYVENNVITLILDKEVAGFFVASDIAESINAQLRGGEGLDDSTLAAGENSARAISPSVIRVPISVAYLADPSRGQDADPAGFIAQVLSLKVPEPQIEARVVINKRAESIVISGDLEIGSVVINQGTLAIEAGAEDSKRFVAIDLEGRRMTPKQLAEQETKTRLQSLIDALNAVQVPTADIIEIIKLIKADGKLYGKLILVE